MTVVASWNVNSIRARSAHLTEWLALVAPDVLGLQETKVQDHEFPQDELRALGYHCVFSGQKSYNGVAVLSREPVEVIATAIPGFADEQRRVLAVACAGFVFLNLYVPNGSSVGSDKYAYKLAWLTALNEWVAELLATHGDLVIVGDFNIAPDDRDVHDPEAWRGQILCSDAEREQLARLCGQGLTDVFRRFDQPPASFSWWDYRAGGFRRNLGLRIDLILATARLAATVASCDIDLTPRRWDKPSDHAPVLARLTL